MAGSFGIEAARTALGDGKPALIWRRQVADTETPVSAALKLMEEGRGDYLLESVEGGETRGRHSMIGLAPDLVFRADGTEAAINHTWLKDRDAFIAEGGDSLAALRKLVKACRMDVPEELPRALACLVGYFGYETIALVEKLPRAPQSELDLPDMLFVRPTVILIFDRLADELFLVAPVWPESDGDADTKIAAAEERLDEAQRGLAAPVRPELVEGRLAGKGEAGFDELGPNGVEFTAQLRPEKYADMVLRAKDYIEAGDIFQVVLAQRFTTPFTLPPIELYRALRRINPSPFLFFLDLPGFALTGSSPEILVRARDGEVTIRPIAGTRPRGKNAAEDKANRDSLLADRRPVGPRQGRARRAVRRLPRRHGQRRAQGARLPDHRRTGTRNPRRLCRRRRLFFSRRQHGQLHRPAHRDRQGRHAACAGRRGHRRGQRSGL